MPVNKIGRFVFVQQGAECLKSSVGQIFTVIKLVGGRVSQQYVKPLPVFQFPPELPHPPAHLRLGILMSAGLIAHGSAKPQ